MMFYLGEIPKIEQRTLGNLPESFVFGVVVAFIWGLRSMGGGRQATLQTVASPSPQY